MSNHNRTLQRVTRIIPDLATVVRLPPKPSSSYQLPLSPERPWSDRHQTEPMISANTVSLSIFLGRVAHTLSFLLLSCFPILFFLFFLAIPENTREPISLLSFITLARRPPRPCSHPSPLLSCRAAQSSSPGCPYIGNMPWQPSNG